MAGLRADRYIESSGLGLELYGSVAELPIVSPHGHIDVRLFSDPAARLDPPGRLFVTADHYVVRMLYSQGVPLERAGLRALDGDLPAVDDRAVWQLLADNVHLFDLTPTGLWLRETLATVFGIEQRLEPASAQAIYAQVEEQLASPGFAPRALLDRFQSSASRRPMPPALGSPSIARSRHRSPASASVRPSVRTQSSHSTARGGGMRCQISRPRQLSRSAITTRSSLHWPSAEPPSSRSAQRRPITPRRAPTRHV